MFPGHSAVGNVPGADTPIIAMRHSSVLWWEEKHQTHWGSTRGYVGGIDSKIRDKSMIETKMRCSFEQILHAGGGLRRGPPTHDPLPFTAGPDEFSCHLGEGSSKPPSSERGTLHPHLLLASRNKSPAQTILSGRRDMKQPKEPKEELRARETGTRAGPGGTRGWRATIMYCYESVREIGRVAVHGLGACIF